MKITRSDACLSSDNSLCADYYGKAIKVILVRLKEMSVRETFCRIIQSSCSLNLTLSHPVCLSMYVLSYLLVINLFSILVKYAQITLQKKKKRAT